MPVRAVADLSIRQLSCVAVALELDAIVENASAGAKVRGIRIENVPLGTRLWRFLKSIIRLIETAEVVTRTVGDVRKVANVGAPEAFTFIVGRIAATIWLDCCATVASVADCAILLRGGTWNYRSNAVAETKLKN